MADGETLPLRSSYPKEKQDTKRAAEKIQDRTTISPWSVGQVHDLVRSAFRTNGLPTDHDGTRTIIEVGNLVNWFENRIQRTTVELSWNEYREALAFANYDVLVSELDPTDMDGIRQRSFAQHLENATSGYLAELAVVKFLESRGLEDVALDIGRTAAVEDMVGSDIAAVTKNGNTRQPRQKVQIKKSKPGSLWLPLAGKDESQADVYVLVRVGMPYEHLAQYLQKTGTFSDILEALPDEKQREVHNKIRRPRSIPAHVTGYATWSDFRDGDLRIAKKRTRAIVEGGIGRIPSNPPDGYESLAVEGLQNPSEDYLAAVDALRNTEPEWTKLIKDL